MKKFFIFLFLVLILSIPVLSFAQTGWGGLVPCTNTPISETTGTGTSAKTTVTIKEPCDFNAFLNLINKVIKFILFGMAVPIAAIMFVYAGVLLVTAGEEAAGARTKAKSIFTNALIGLVLAAACWLIVRTILAILGYDGDWIGFPKL